MYRRLALAALIALAARADVTIRRSMTVTLGPAFPAQMQEMMKQQMASIIPFETVIRIKGSKAYSSAGQLVSITDYGTNQVILLNPKTKQYAIGTLTDYMDKMAAITQTLTQGMPAQATQMLQNMKFDVQTKKTGQTSTIQGILAEESVITMSMGMPMGQTVMPTVRMEMHCWIAQPDQVELVAGLKELIAYTARDKVRLDPTQALQKIFSQMPGLSEQIREPMAQLTGNGAMMLNMRAAIFLPAMAQALPQADPTSPMEELQSGVTEISTAPIDDAVFSVPADYQSAALEDLIKLALPAIPQPPAR